MTKMNKKVENGSEIIEVDLGPDDILSNPLLNKGTGFTNEERSELGLHGLLPFHTSTIEEQVNRLCKVSKSINKHWKILIFIFPSKSKRNSFLLSVQFTS